MSVDIFDRENYFNFLMSFSLNKKFSSVTWGGAKIFVSGMPGYLHPSIKQIRRLKRDIISSFLEV